MRIVLLENQKIRHSNYDMWTIPTSYEETNVAHEKKLNLKRVKSELYEKKVNLSKREKMWFISNKKQQQKLYHFLFDYLYENCGWKGRRLED